MAGESDALGTFHGDDEFPIEWEEGERELFWIFDDLHCPNPLSPMFFDIGGWWLTCDHMFRRFGTPFAADWIVKNVNGYALHGGDPGRPGAAGRGDRVRGPLRAARAARPRLRRARSAPYLGCRAAALRGQLPRLVARPPAARDRAQLRLPRRLRHEARVDLVELAVLLEDAIDIHDRHWKIHWMLNFAQFSATIGLNATIADVKGEVDPALLGRLQSSVDDRNWDSIEALWRMKEEVKADAELRCRLRAATPPPTSLRALEGVRARAARSSRSGSIPYRREFGNKAIWSHEFVFPTWRENPAPIVEAVRGYLETDYDYPADARGREGRPRGGGRRADGRRARRARRRDRAPGARSTSRCG